MIHDNFLLKVDLEGIDWYC